MEVIRERNIGLNAVIQRAKFKKIYEKLIVPRQCNDDEVYGRNCSVCSVAMQQVDDVKNNSTESDKHKE